MTPQFKADVNAFKIPYGTPLWYQFRTTGIPEYAGGVGASESGKLLGMDNYRPVPPELYAHKIGYAQPTELQKVAVEKGKLLEPIVRNIWEFWEGNTEEENYQALKKLNDFNAGIPVQKKRTCSQYGYYLVNPKYPFLFCSLDGIIDAGQPDCDGVPLRYSAPLEVKTIAYWAAQQWDLRIPPKYGVQVDQQMLITGSPYAELIMWEDGAIRVYRFSENMNSQRALIQAAYQFWQKVTEGRRLYALLPEYAGDVQGTNDIWAQIMANEPDPDSTEAYKEYIKERNNGVDIIQGTAEAYRYARNYARLTALEKEIKEYKQLSQNQILKVLDKWKAGGMEFGENGKVVAGSKFNCNVKPKPDLQEVKETIGKLLQLV